MSENKNIDIPEITPELQRGPGWLKEKRQSLRKHFNNMEIPARGLHLWRYTDPNKFIYDRDKTIDTTFNDNYKKIEQLELENLKNKHIDCFISDMGGRDIQIHKSDSIDESIVISSLSDAVNTHQKIIKNNLYQLVNSNTGKFEAQNGTLWNDGIFIYIPDNKKVEKPIHLLRESGMANSVQYPRLLIVLGENAELTVIDEYSGGSTDIEKGASYTNSAVEIFAGDNSHAQYISLLRQTAAANSYITHRAKLGANASMVTIPLVFGGAVSKNNFGVILNGKGADSKIYGLVFGSQHQHLDNHTLHHHTAGMTTSDIDFKVVLKDKALSAYTGLIKIDHDAKTCEAYQENRNLLLNKGCQAEAIPELEILNEDVMCSHGATVGPIDPEMVFYLRCRGIDHDEAVKMIISGFIQTTLKQVPEDLQKRVAEFTALRLEHI